MSKFVVCAFDENKCWVMIDKETNEPFLHIPPEAVLEPVQVEAKDYDDAKSVFYQNGNYTDDVQIAEIWMPTADGLQFKEYM